MKSAWTRVAGTDRSSRLIALIAYPCCAPLTEAGFCVSRRGGTSTLRTMMAGKIHRATVTEANLDYEGSITLDPDLMEAAGILPYEKVHVLDVTNGARLETYAILGRRGTREVCINGGAAHLVHKGDLVIIVTYQQMSEEAAHGAAPRQVHVDADNRIKRVTLGDGYAAKAREAAGIT